MKTHHRKHRYRNFELVAGPIALVMFATPFWTSGCSSSSPPVSHVVIQSTPPQSTVEKVPDDTASTVPPPGDTISDTAAEDNLESLVRRDAHRARDILLSGLHSNVPHLASWSAVYLRLLGVNAPSTDVKDALLSGANSDTLLLQILCLRWLVKEDASLPDIDSTTGEPLLQIFAALGLIARNPTQPATWVPEALSVGHASQFHSEKIPLNTILYQTAPFDNGPLALAIAFVNARRMETATKVADIKVPLSARYRQQLLKTLQLGNVSIEQPVDDRRFSYPGTTVLPFLENPLNGQPLPILRNAIITANSSLKTDALRSLAASALTPEVDDFAATAAAFHSDQEFTRIEAARTYLLLVARATEED